MNALQQHEIAESSHRILNPFTDEKLMLLGELCRLQAGQRQLDLASGKGEMLCRWAERFVTSGLGVDISDYFVPAARARAAELGVDDRVRFEHADASTFVADPAAYDVVSCIGATWIGDGLVGTIELMRPALRPGGLLLVGEPFWNEGAPAGVAEEVGVGPDDFTTLVGTLDRFEEAGTELIEMVLADGDSWDRYGAAQWWNVHEWLRANPEHPDAPQMRDHLEHARREHLHWRRPWLGWGVFVLRDR